MGKITSLIEFNGTVGNLVGYRGRDGRNVVRFKVHNPRNPQTTLQMRRRVSWANLVNLWAAITPYMHPSFNHKPTGQTDFNAFMSENVGISPVFLTKKQAHQQECVVSPIMVTDGELPTIGTSLVSGGKLQSTIVLGDLVIGAETTIAAFSTAILAENPDFAEGDQITGLLVKQISVGTEGLPKVEVIAQRVVLDTTDTRVLADVLAAESGSADAMFSAVEGYLASKASVNGGACWIHSRMVGGETIVSTQNLSVNNNILASYSSAAAQVAAMKSYGVNEKYLTPSSNRYTAPASI